MPISHDIFQNNQHRRRRQISHSLQTIPRRIELSIVESGARRDLGQNDAAVITLQRLPELRDTQAKPSSARLALAYADALADAGHQEAATDWFAKAMAFDEDGETDAAERYAELTGAVIEDVEEDFDDEDDLDNEDDFEDAGTADQADQADEVDENVDEDSALAEAGDLLDDLEPADGQTADAEPADQRDDTAGQADDPAAQQDLDDQDRSADLDDVDDEQDGSAGLQDVDDERDGSAGQAESAPEPVESASAQDTAEETAPETSKLGDILDGPEDAEPKSGDLLDGPGTAQSDAPASEARLPEVPITLGINPAFIEPDFGDILDQSDEPAEDAPKRDSKRED